jgi:hypothetical protein
MTCLEPDRHGGVDAAVSEHQPELDFPGLLADHCERLRHMGEKRRLEKAIHSSQYGMSR